MSLKNPVTPPGIDPGTVRLVAQRLNHYATPGLLWHCVISENAAIHIVCVKCNSIWFLELTGLCDRILIWTFVTPGVLTRYKTVFWLHRNIVGIISVVGRFPSIGTGPFFVLLLFCFNITYFQVVINMSVSLVLCLCWESASWAHFQDVLTDFPLLVV